MTTTNTQRSLFVSLCLSLALVVFAIESSSAFVPTCSGTAAKHRLGSTVQLQAEKKGGFFQGVQDFFEELDNFIDDASARRLGNGAAFYGKRKSNFYGENDKNRKVNAKQADPTEDYQAPSTGGYFQWVPDEDGQMRPVTRMKKQVVEKGLSYWDKVYDKQDKESK